MASETLKRWLILGGLLALTIWLVWTLPEIKNNSVLAVVNPTRTATSHDEGQNNKLDYVFELKQRTPSSGNEFDVFGTQVKQTNHKTKLIAKASPVLKPTIPRLPFSYVGKLVENGVVKVFLMQGDALHIVKSGDKMGLKYQIKEVTEQQVTFLYLPLNITQTMSIGKAP